MSKPWEKYFIVDTSVTAVQGLRFGRGFICFLPDDTPHFGCLAENIKLYDTKEDYKIDYDKIENQVAVYHIIIQPQKPVAYTIVEKK